MHQHPTPLPRSGAASPEATSTRPLPAQARILVVKAAGLGDLVLALPALRALRQTYPHARIDLLVSPQAAALVCDSPLVDRMLTVDKTPFDTARAVLRAPWRVFALTRLAWQLHTARYDAVLLLHHLTLPFGRLKYRLLLAATRPARTYGLDNSHGGFLDVRVPDAGFGARHEAEYCLAVAHAAGATLPPTLEAPRLADLGWNAPPHAAPVDSAIETPYAVRECVPPPVSKHSAKGDSPRTSRARSAPLPAGQSQPHEMTPGIQFRGAPRTTTVPLATNANGNAPLAGPLIALHVGSGTYSLARRWPLDRFVFLARALHRATDARILLIGGDDERALVAAAHQALGDTPWVLPTTADLSLRETAARLARCDLFIGNDAFPMHLAAAAGVPVVAIFGPSNAPAWRPLPRDPDRPAVVVRRDLACSPCFYRGHTLGTPQGCPPRPCLEELPVAAVLRAALRLLRDRQIAGYVSPEPSPPHADTI